MTVIKIRDPEWFKQNCKVSAATDALRDLIPKHKSWKNADAFPWTSGDCAMSPLEGQVLKVQWDEGILAGDITDARYQAKGYWIPNWAIEWVKEVE